VKKVVKYVPKLNDRKVTLNEIIDSAKQQQLARLEAKKTS
jgi:hypothetical protein